MENKLSNWQKRFSSTLFGAAIVDIVPGLATLSHLGAKLRRSLKKPDFPLDQQDLMEFFAALSDASAGTGTIAGEEDLDLVRILGTSFFGDDGPKAHARDRSEYFSALWSANPNVFCFYQPFARNGIHYPCGYTSVMPINPSTLKRYFHTPTESQFEWSAYNIVSPDEIVTAHGRGDLSEYGIYIQAVGCEKVLRDTTRRPSTGVAVQAFFHLAYHLREVSAENPEDLPLVVLEGTTAEGETFIRRWPGLFAESGVSADKNPLFQMNPGMLFNLLEGAGTIPRDLFHHGMEGQD